MTPADHPDPEPLVEPVVEPAPAPEPLVGRAPLPTGDPSSWMERFVSGYATDGPRVRLGILWFVVMVVAIAIGVGAVAVVVAVVAGAAGSQASAAWRRAGRRPNQVVAGIGALVMPIAAAFGIGLFGLTALAVVAVAVGAAFFDPTSPDPPFETASLTLRAGFFAGCAAASIVLLDRTSGEALVALLVLVSGYEIGDYLVGTGASSPAEGPIAGIAAVLVLTFAISVFAFPPFETGSAWVFGGLAAALAPLGPYVGSALVPSADARVPALRRLDSWLLVAPLWAWLLWSYLL